MLYTDNVLTYNFVMHDYNKIIFDIIFTINSYFMLRIKINHILSKIIYINLENIKYNCDKNKNKL